MRMSEKQENVVGTVLFGIAIASSIALVFCCAYVAYQMGWL